jgi:hypothetical protein
MTPIYFKGLLYFPGKSKKLETFRPYLMGHNRAIYSLIKVRDGLYKVPVKAAKHNFFVIVEGNEKPLQVVRL